MVRVLLPRKFRMLHPRIQLIANRHGVGCTALLAGLICVSALSFGAEPQQPEPKKEAEVNLTPGAKARPGLYEEILNADAEFFKAFFDTCDVETVRRYVTDDFEMFHDKGGRVSTSGAQFVKETQEKCRRQQEGTDFLSTRKLVPETVRVYPINNYGAIETGTHRFYAIQKGKPDRLTETAQFTHVWKEENGQWRLARALSYDHQLAESR
jgi:ketosteroid isomerase-like protein